MKALIQIETGQSRRTHNLGGLREALSHQAGASDTRTGQLCLQAKTRLGDAQIMAWRPEMR